MNSKNVFQKVLITLMVTFASFDLRKLAFMKAVTSFLECLNLRG